MHSINDAAKYLVDAIKHTYHLSNPDLDDTPDRVSRAYEEFLSGYKDNPAEILSARFKTKSAGIVVVANIDFQSQCEHHLLPFVGVCHIGYMPSNNEVVGLSKIPRLVECFAKRLQLQENMGNQIVEALDENLNTQGSGCIIRAKHFCSGHRGVKKPNAEMVTSTLTGIFLNPSIRQEFYDLISLK